MSIIDLSDDLYLLYTTIKYLYKMIFLIMMDY